MKFIQLLTLLVFFSFTYSCMPVMKQVAKVKYNRYAGEKIPDFAYLNSNGETLRIGDLGGQVYYINYWRVDDACFSEEVPMINEMESKLKEYDEAMVLNICVKGSREDWFEKVKGNNFRGQHLYLVDNERNDRYQSIPGAMDFGVPLPMIVTQKREIMGSGMGVSSGEQVVTIYMMKKAEEGIRAGNAAKQFIKVATRHQNGKDSHEVREFSEFVNEFDKNIEKGG